MIKLQPPGQSAGSYHNFRCGEIFCVGPTTYHICCALCGQRIAYDSFPQHFRLEHLTQPEDCKLFEAQPDEQLTIKSEEDPIAHECQEVDKNPTVDLAQIALFDAEPEPETNVMTRKRRAAALKNTLVLQSEDAMNNEEEFIDTRYCENSNETEDFINYEDDGDDVADCAKDMLFPCDQCERAYNTKRSLQGHKRSKHTAKTDSSSSARKKRKPKGPAKVYKCNECDQTFRTERDLGGHRWKHTGIFCDICGKPFTQTGNMMRHKLRHSGVKPYKCQECAATFYTQKELTSHNICHTGRMPCICEVCGRPCRDRGVLTAHMRRHTGERPAKCEVCGKAFYSFHDLNVHAVSHTNLRPFVCDVCGSTFQRKKALRVHKLLHSEQHKYACKLCSKTFAQPGSLNAHIRTHENAKTRAKSATTAASCATSTPDEEQVLEELITEEPSAQASEITLSMTVQPASWHVP